MPEKIVTTPESSAEFAGALLASAMELHQALKEHQDLLSAHNTTRGNSAIDNAAFVNAVGGAQTCVEQLTQHIKRLLPPKKETAIAPETK